MAILVEVAATNDWRHDAEATATAVLAELDTSAPDPVFGSQPGRYEQVNLPEVRPSRWIFDGAHNPMKLAALVGPLRSEPGPRLGIVSVGEGKDLAGCAAAIASALDAAIVVPFGPLLGAFGPRSHPTSGMVDAFRAAGVADVTEVTDAAAAVAIATARSEVSTVVVTGSFLHLNDVRRALLRRRTQREGM